MKKSILLMLVFITLLLASSKGYSQADSLNFGPEPIGGINKLALEYYRIDFTKEQREALRGVEIEFIYLVDESGVPALEEINGVHDQAILDSLMAATKRLPGFYPGRVNGVKESTLYFVKLQFPAYSLARSRIPPQQNRWNNFMAAKYEDYEYIHKSGEKLDILLGGVVNSFSGSPAEYLAWGGGMKMDLMYVGTKGIGGGIIMNFYGNTLKKEYPIESTREQNVALPTLLIGLGGNKVITERERSEFHLQVELAFAIQNVTPRLGEWDKDWTQLRGFSPGFVANYLVQLGKNHTSSYYGSPVIASHYINVHGAVRPVFFNLKEATGVMFEFGVSYRLRSHFVDEYQLKPEFYNY